MFQIGKIILAILLLVGGGIGLGLTLCGAAFTVSGFSSGADVMILSLPALGIGIALLYAVVKGLRKLFGDAQVTADVKDEFADTQVKVDVKTE